MILPLSCPILEEHYSFCFSPHNFAYEAVTPFGAAFQQLRLLVRISAPHPPRIAARLFRTLSLVFSRLTHQMPIGLFSLPLLESFNSRGFCALLRVALPSDHRLPAPTRSVSPLAAVPKSFEPSHPLNGVTYIPLSVSLQVALRPHEILPKLARYFVHRHEIRVIILGNVALPFGRRPFLKKSRVGLTEFLRLVTLRSVNFPKTLSFHIRPKAVEYIKG